MRFLFFRALWLSSVVTARLITITERRGCSTSAVFTSAVSTSAVSTSAVSTSTVSTSTVSTAPVYNSTQSAIPSSSSSFSLPTSPRPTGLSPIFGSTGPPPGSSGPVLGSTGPGGLSQSDKVDYLFWLEFAKAIRTAASIMPDDNSAFFIGSTAQRGPIAGDNIPESYTNQGLYEIANNLLNDTSIFYTPAATNSYIDALSNYLDHTDLEANPTPKQENDLLNAINEQAIVQDQIDRELPKALVIYQTNKDAGLITEDTDFPRWLSESKGRAAVYQNAVARANQLADVIDSLQAEISGVKASARADVRAGLALAKTGAKVFNPGYNMKAAAGAGTSIAKQIVCTRQTPEEAAKSCPPANDYYVPLYNAPNYKTFVQDAQSKSDDKYDPVNSVDVSVDTSKSTSEFNFGQTSIGANARGTGWFSFFSASGQRTTESSQFSTNSAASSVSIKITYDDMQQIAMNPGQWNFNYRDFKLRTDAPPFLKYLIRPSGLVVATRLGYEITVSGSLATSLDTHFKQTTSVNAGFSIFSTRIFGASVSKTDERNTHSATWSSASKTLKIVPRDSFGAATLLGVVGERIQI